MKYIALSSTLLEKSQPRVRGEIYEIRGTLHCSNCGMKYFNFGTQYKSEGIRMAKCQCGQALDLLGFKWTSAKYYVECTPKAIQLEIDNRLSIEDYETCSMLSKHIQSELVK